MSIRAEDVMKPTPFTINIGEDILADLRARLALARWPDHIPGAGWRYGTDPAYVNQLAEYWRDRYDWRAQEARLNTFRHFSVPLHGIDLHFIHQPGVGAEPLPLLISHGWPGSVWEFHKLIPLLTDPARSGGDPADAFTVVAPSLLGYGFSFRPNQPRFGVRELSDIFARLMTDVLGYMRFGAQGGDWGAFITSLLGLNHAEHVVGIHLNLLPLRRDVDLPQHPTPEERVYLKELQHWLDEETGYQGIQGTKP